jgi:beta-glucosidase
VSFTLHDRGLSVVDEAGTRRVTRGNVNIWVGGGQPVAQDGQPAGNGASVNIKITTESVLPD